MQLPRPERSPGLLTMSSETELILKGMVLGAVLVGCVWAGVGFWRLTGRRSLSPLGFLGGRHELYDIKSAYPSPSALVPNPVRCPRCDFACSIEFNRGTMLCGNCLHVYRP